MRVPQAGQGGFWPASGDLRDPAIKDVLRALVGWLYRRQAIGPRSQHREGGLLHPLDGPPMGSNFVQVTNESGTPAGPWVVTTQSIRGGPPRCGRVRTGRARQGPTAADLLAHAFLHDGDIEIVNQQASDETSAKLSRG